jgi:hypothetical protein
MSEYCYNRGYTTEGKKITERILEGLNSAFFWSYTVTTTGNYTKKGLIKDFM